MDNFDVTSYLMGAMSGGGGGSAGVFDQWTPNENASAISDRCFYKISGGLLVVNVSINMAASLSNQTSIAICNDMADTFGVTLQTSAVMSAPAITYDAAHESKMVRIVINNNMLSIQNDSGMTIPTTYAIYGQVIIPVT